MHASRFMQLYKASEDVTENKLCQRWGETPVFVPKGLDISHEYIHDEAQVFAIAWIPGLYEVGT